MKNTVILLSSSAFGKALFLDDTLVNSVSIDKDTLPPSLNTEKYLSDMESSATNLAAALSVSVNQVIVDDEKFSPPADANDWKAIFDTLRQEGRIRPGGTSPNGSLPYQLTINVSAESESDLVDAVTEISSQLDEGYTEGFDSNDNGAYTFVIVHKPAPLLTP